MTLRCLVLGANGQVGRQLGRALQPLGELRVVGRHECDLSRPGEAMRLIAASKPRVVVNAAAYTAVDRAEEEPALAHRVNGDAVAEVVDACAQVGAVMVHYSTDYVFDGAGDRPFAPNDAAKPLSVYGASKLAGEQAIRASGVSHLLLRTSWVFDNLGHNFLNTMLRLGGERDTLQVVCDQIGAPTWAATIADVTALALHEWYRNDFSPAMSGTYHLCSRGETSWHGFAEAIFAEASAMGLLRRCPVVEPIPSSAYPQRAKRPANSRLEVAAIEERFGLRLPSWQEALCCALRQRVS